MIPNVDGALMAVPGLLNWGWLNALNASARNSRLASSWIPPTRVCLVIDKSQLFCPGPLRIARPVLPNIVAFGSPTLFGASGNGHAAFVEVAADALANALELKKPLRRDSTLPLVKMLLYVIPGQSWARDVVMPNAPAPLASVNVIY